VDYQYQVRTFPREPALASNEDVAASASKEHVDEDIRQEGDPTSTASTGKALPGILGLLLRRAGAAKQTAMKFLSSFAIAMRSSHVADFYATKYLAKPQQWLASVLGPLIAGFRRVEEKKEQAQEQLSTKAQALRNVRTAIFAANRSVWISCCEACLFLQTESSAVLSHRDAVVHGRKGLFMMHECKRILNKEVTGTGLWQVTLSKDVETGGGDCLQVHGEVAEESASAASIEEGSEDEEESEAEGAEMQQSSDEAEGKRSKTTSSAAEHVLESPRSGEKSRKVPQSMSEEDTVGEQGGAEQEESERPTKKSRTTDVTVTTPEYTEVEHTEGAAEPTEEDEGPIDCEAKYLTKVGEHLARRPPGCMEAFVQDGGGLEACRHRFLELAECFCGSGWREQALDDILAEIMSENGDPRHKQLEENIQLSEEYFYLKALYNSALQQEEPEGAAEDLEQTKPVQIFQMTVSLRDDWLHRGDALQDMDLQTYAEYVERIEKPMRGVDMQKYLRLQIFAFDAHYKLAKGYVQALRRGKRRCIARFNMPNCLRENVNEGEENAQFKAFHCSLLRCLGPGQCADPLVCANVLFLGQDGKHRFRPSWRARESEILTLALRGQEKKQRARRLETLHDTSLCKAYVATEHVHANATATVEVRAASRFLQIDLQRLFRQRMRSLREDASAESPCMYGYPERMVHAILCYVGASSLECGEDALYLVGVPLWHEEQLHLAEWQALGSFEFLFNLTLSVDAKNMALEKLKAHKGATSADAEGEQPNNPLNTCEGEDVGPIADDDLILMDEPPASGALLPPVTDQEELLHILGRTQEVALARQPGQGRREGPQNMREMMDTFGIPKHLQTNGRDPSCFGAAEHEKTAALANHQTCLETLRDQRENNPIVENGMDEATVAAVQEAGVEVLQDADENLEMLGPVDLAKRLCDKSTPPLTLEQRGPVALIARDMEKAYEIENQRRASLTEAQREALVSGPRLPLKGRRLRVLIYGGGGCGKTTIINQVLTPLFRRFYGPRGLIKTAFANKPARLIKGKTSHTLVKMRGAQSLTIARLRITNDKQRRGLAAVWAPAGALVKDEFTQQPATLEHALVVRATYGRETFHDLVSADYAQPETNYASLPYVVTSGDPLQFPPVPMTSSLLAEPEGQSKEHRVATAMFEDQDYVCELKTTMRFRNDPVLSRILSKMRTPGEDRSELRLTDEEWRALQSTDIAHGASLEGTELWYHAAYAWSFVCMAQWIRSLHSAAYHQETLFLCAARDYIKNVEQRDLQAVRDQLLRIPNMNNTGRLPAVALLHVNMKIRLTVTVCPSQAPVDTTGTIKNIELDMMDRARWQQQPSNSIFVLHRMPTVLVLIDEDNTDTGLGPGVIAVKAVQCESFFVTVELPNDSERGCVRTLGVSVVREQVPTTILGASTLYTLQGTTATPGLIYHFRTPRRLPVLMKWISLYMALSRVQSLREFRGIGISNAIRDLINNGPPLGFLTRFLSMFEEKAKATEKAMEEALQELRWN